MTNEDFDQFIKVHENHKSKYLKGTKRGLNADSKHNQRGNTDKNVGATGRELS